MSQHGYEAGRSAAFGTKAIGCETVRDIKRRVIFAEGEEKRVLHAAQWLLENDKATPILIGDTRAIVKAIDQERLELKLGKDVEVYPPYDQFEYRDQSLREVLAKHHKWDVSSRAVLHRSTRNTPVAARLVEAGVADFLVCGATGRYSWHLAQLTRVLTTRSLEELGTLHLTRYKGRNVFLLDCFDNGIKTPAKIAQTSYAAAEYLRQIGYRAKMWLCAHVDYGSPAASSNEVMRNARARLLARSASLPIIGPVSLEEAMAGDKGEHTAEAYTDVIVFCGSDAAAMARAILRRASGDSQIGPLLLGLANKAHIVSSEVAAQGIADLASFAAGNPKWV